MTTLRLYTLPTCPHCIHTKKHLDEINVPYETVTLTADLRPTILALTGQTSVPQGLFVSEAPFTVHTIASGGEGVRNLFPTQMPNQVALANGLSSKTVSPVATTSLTPSSLLADPTTAPPSPLLAEIASQPGTIIPPLSKFSANTAYAPVVPVPESESANLIIALKATLPSPLDPTSETWSTWLSTYSKVLSTVPLPTQPTHLKAFVIELYNLSIKVSARTNGNPVTAVSRLSYFDKCGVTLTVNSTPLFISFNQLENGLLRSNSIGPYHLRPALASNSPLLPFIQPIDHRIHSALNCGATSCPPVLAYGPDTLEEDLDAAWKSWICDRSGAFVDGDVVRFSMITKWYKKDFDKAGGIVGLWEVATGETLGGREVGNMEYDWGGGGGDKVFEASTLGTLGSILFK